MGRGLGIKEAAKERGITLSSLARRLGIQRSNMSAIASGARGVSLKVLTKLCRILDCGMDEIVPPYLPPSVFEDKAAQSLLNDTERRNYDGMDKTWVDRVMMAQKIHYKKSRQRRG